MGIIRAETIARMRGAFREGLSASRFIADMKAAGLSYRRTDMLSDWGTINELEKKEGLVRFVRKDRYPTKKVIASVAWEMSQEYMYKIKVQSIIRAGEPITERFVNIMSDVPMTVGIIETELGERWSEYEKYGKEKIVGMQVWSAARKTMV